MLYFVVLFLFLHFVGIETDLAWQINITLISRVMCVLMGWTEAHQSH